MSALLRYATDPDTKYVVFAVVADDEGAQYAWPAMGGQLWDDTRVQTFQQALGVEPSNASEWMSLALTNVWNFDVSDPVSVSDRATGLTQARDTLNAQGPQPDLPLSVQSRASESFDQTAEDYPGFADDTDVEEDPQAMTNFVLGMLGGIDPDGPNAWILQEADKPTVRAEDEAAPGVVHVPGVVYTTSTPAAQDGEE